MSVLLSMLIYARHYYFRSYVLLYCVCVMVIVRASERRVNLTNHFCLLKIMHLISIKLKELLQANLCDESYINSALYAIRDHCNFFLIRTYIFNFNQFQVANGGCRSIKAMEIWWPSGILKVISKFMIDGLQKP